MTLSLTLASLWAIAATATAFLPLRMQYPPGIALLVSVPFLLGFIAWQHGPWIGLLALAAVVSMFRRPLIHLYRRGRAAIAGRGDEGPAP